MQIKPSRSPTAVIVLLKNHFFKRTTKKLTNQAPPHMNDKEIVNFQEDERVYLHNLNKEISS